MNVDELKEKLIESKKITFEDVNIEDLEDISNINFSKKQNSQEKILDFIKTSKNPYMFKCNGKKIKIEFANCERKAEEALTNVIKNIYQ